MQNRDAFSAYHPIVNFLYFALVFGYTMVFMHPVCLLISLVSAIWYYLHLRGMAALRFLLRIVMPSLLLAALINPAFNHQGKIFLCYLPTGNPLTLESILYGLAAGCMLAAVLLWFACYSEIMTSDKFVYLFGRIIPALSLVLSMALRFVPKCKAQLDEIREAQACIGRDTATGSVFQRFKNALTCFSVMVTWALEDAIETADSMKSRGYGLPGRTAFSIYTFSARDRLAIIWLMFCGWMLFFGNLSGQLFWRWFPSVRGLLAEPMTIWCEMVYLLLCITPLFLDYREEKVWKRLQSGI